MKHDLAVASKTAYRALTEGGERRSLMRFFWNLAGPCLAPQTVLVFGRPSPKKGKYIVVEKGSQHPIEVELETRCRKCAPCLKLRQAYWRERCLLECQRASRTWFGTLTFTPQWHNHFLNEMLVRSDAMVSDVERSKDLMFAELVAEEGKEVTRYLKRVRTNSGARVRYALVAEECKDGAEHGGTGENDGFPHYHVLLHEVSKPVRHSVLKAAWRCGFTDFKLVKDEQKAVWYTTKYLLKDARTRIRASVRYGADGAAAAAAALLPQQQQGLGLPSEKGPTCGNMTSEGREAHSHGLQSKPLRERATLSDLSGV